MASFEERFWDLLRESARSAAPPPALSVCKWSEQHLVLSHFSRLAGIYKVIYTLRELMDALGAVLSGPEDGADERARPVPGIG